MAFQNIVDATRLMNAKMIAMGQSVDIQKMPRPKPGTQTAQRAATYTPSGSDIEKLLYPKNFKPRVYESEPQQKLQTANEQMVEEIREQTEVREQMQEAPEVKEAPRIIGDDAVIMEAKKETPTEINQKTFSGPIWTRCKHYKAQGDRAFCKEYLGWCAKDKCSRPQL